MSIRENIQNIFKPKGIREAEKIAQLNEVALIGDRATAAYMRGEISVEQFSDTLEEIYPVSKINPRKPASDRNKSSS